MSVRTIFCEGQPFVDCCSQHVPGQLPAASVLAWACVVVCLQCSSIEGCGTHSSAQLQQSAPGTEARQRVREARL